MKNKNLTLLLLVAAITLVSVMAFYVRIGVTADSVAVLRTTGMTCSSCSEKISKALESVKGVAATEVDVEGGWVVIGYDKKTVAPEILAEKVTGTGFFSKLSQVLTPEQFKDITGRDIGKSKSIAGSGGCCGKGGCGGGKNS